MTNAQTAAWLLFVLVAFVVGIGAGRLFGKDSDK
jgi:hypothetical protein